MLVTIEEIEGKKFTVVRPESELINKNDMATNNCAFMEYYLITHAIHNGERVEIAIEGEL